MVPCPARDYDMFMNQPIENEHAVVQDMLDNWCLDIGAATTMKWISSINAHKYKETTDYYCHSHGGHTTLTGTIDKIRTQPAVQRLTDTVRNSFTMKLQVEKCGNKSLESEEDMWDNNEKRKEAKYNDARWELIYVWSRARTISLGLAWPHPNEYNHLPLAAATMPAPLYLGLLYGLPKEHSEWIHSSYIVHIFT